MSDVVKILKNTKSHIMTGVSYMIPFVVAGGVTLAAMVLFSGQAAVPEAGVLADFANVGIAGLTMMVPVLSGYMAYSIADRAGLAPGFIGGMIAAQIGAGFLGGLVSGLVAGIIVFYLKKIKLPDAVSSVLPILIIPLVGTLATCALMLYVVGSPIAGLMESLTGWLNSMGEGNAIILGIALGAMICFDMGGPVNKVAYTFAATLIGTVDAVTGLPSTAALNTMGAVGSSIAVPPLACFLATILFRKKFNATERDAGTAALLMGCVGITEGAIPFAAANPIRVIPSLMVGGGVAGALAMVLGAGNPAPWGGLIVMPIGTNPLGYFIATFVGSLVGALIMGVLFQPTEEETVVVDDDELLDIELEF